MDAKPLTKATSRAVKRQRVLFVMVKSIQFEIQRAQASSEAQSVTGVAKLAELTVTDWEQRLAGIAAAMPFLVTDKDSRGSCSVTNLISFPQHIAA